jgi:hypothetical protein
MYLLLLYSEISFLVESNLKLCLLVLSLFICFAMGSCQL